MKSFAAIIQRIGSLVVMVGIIIMFSRIEVNDHLIPILFSIGIVIALVGGLVGSMGKLEMGALFLIFLATIIYFYGDQEIILNFLISGAILLVVLDIVLKFKNKKTA